MYVVGAFLLSLISGRAFASKYNTASASMSYNLGMNLGMTELCYPLFNLAILIFLASANKAASETWMRTLNVKRNAKL